LRLEASPPDDPEAARLVERPRSGGGSRRRLYAALVLLGCGGVLAVAAWLKPAPRGYGTHRQFGFGKCAMLVTTGLPCPTCGMTTAFAYTVRGRLISAFLAQPAGFLLALAVIACAVGAGWVVVTGRVPPVPVPTVTPYRLFFTLLVLLIGGWAFKIVFGLLTGTLPERG
jgi:hypothetical protein